MDIGNISMPVCEGALVAFTADSYVDSGETQPLTADNVFRLRGRALCGSTLQRFVFESSAGTTAGGDLAAQRNRIEGGYWDGTPTTRAMEFGGLKSVVRDVVCSSGDLRVGSSAVGLQSFNSVFPDHVSFPGGAAGHEVIGLVSNTTKTADVKAAAFLAASTRDGNQPPTSSTSEIILGTTSTISAGLIGEGDQFEVTVYAEFSGTAGTKTISFNLAVDTDADDADLDAGDDANKISLTVPSAASDAVAVFKGVAQSGAIVVLSGNLQSSETDSVSVSRFTGMDTANKVTRLEVSGLVANGADSMTVRSIVRKVTTA